MSAAADSFDLEELREAARRVLDDHRAGAGSAEALWTTLSSLGWMGLGVATASGGLGQPFAALSVLYQELGRILAPHSFIATTACLQAMSEMAGAPGVRQVLADALGGKIVLADLTAPDVSVVEERGCMRGCARHVLDVDHATHALLRVDAPVQRVLLVRLSQPGVSLSPQSRWDETRGLFDVSFDGFDAQDTPLLAVADEARAMCEVLAGHTDLALACDSLGSAQALFDATLEYLAIRRQFDRPIGSFQAIKHRCADLATALAGARSLLGAAGWQYTRRSGDWRTAAAACRLQVESVCREVCEEGIQLHGGIGFTWDHACHRHLKRTRCTEALGGRTHVRQDQVAAALFRAARRPASAAGGTLAN